MSNEDYKRGYREGFKDGVSLGKDTTENLDNTTIKVKPYPSVEAAECSICGREPSVLEAFGYVCYKLDCPSKAAAL